MFLTTVAKTDGSWRVDVGETRRAHRDAVIASSVGDAQRAIQQGAEALGDAIEQGLQEAAEAMERALEDIERDLDEQSEPGREL